ncbi:MAG: sodium ion-translocating decarboxylase subunit beta [Terrimicrobiaceae bacterium]
MSEALLGGFLALTEGLRAFVATGGPNLLMIGVSVSMLVLAIRHGVEPLLFLPIAFGCLLVNLPLSGVMHPDGVLRTIYEMGITNELYPLLIFIGIGSMTDFSPLLSNPKLLLFGAAGQVGIFVTLILALALGLSRPEAVSAAAIGACDGPTVIFVSNLFAERGQIPTSMVGALAVAAYSYMALVPVIQPPIMRLLTTKAEREAPMPGSKGKVSREALMAFPIVVVMVTGVVAPQGLPLMGMIMLGNFIKVSGVVPRLAGASENEIANVATLFLGLAIGGTMVGQQFLTRETLTAFGLGLVAITTDTVGGLLLGKLWYRWSGGRINPLVGAAGLSAYPIAARLVQTEGQKWNKQNHLLMHAMAANTGGQIGSVMAAAIMLSTLKGLGVL